MELKIGQDSVWSFTPELMDNKEILDQYRLLSRKAEENFAGILEEHNGIVKVLEAMMTEPDWREIRAHLTMLEDYAGHFDTGQKKVVIQYLFALLFHDNGTIRRQSAHTMGHILCSCMQEDPGILADIFHRILFQSGKSSEYKRRWIGNSLKVILTTMLERLPEKDEKEVLRIYGVYFKSSKWGRLTCLNLLEGIMEIPWNRWSSMQRGYIFDFLRNFLKNPDDELREAALWLLDFWISGGWYCPPDVKSYLIHLTIPEDARICEHYLLARIRFLAGSGKLPSDGAWQDQVIRDLDIDYEVLFHENLQFDHYWVYKVINLDILKQQYAGLEKNALYQYATHLLNILRMNTMQEVFWRAGEDLVEIFPLLLQHQKYEIIQEIFKAIELRDDSSNYIPSFLGRTFPRLDMEKQKEFLTRIRLLADSRSRDTIKIIAETLCVIMASMGDAAAEDQAGEDRKYASCVRNQRREFLGILCRCMAGYRSDVSVETIFLVGNILCQSPERQGWEWESFLYFVRKVLIYIRDTTVCHEKAYMLTVIGRIEVCLEKAASQGAVRSRQEGAADSRKIAIFSDSFDPFTMGQKAVVQEAVDSGYHVYLNVHNFFWAKNTQPLLIRRLIASITIADIRGAWLLPVDLPVNTACPDDLERLANLFPGQEIYIITGSDVAGVSEAYLQKPEPYSIHHFPHIIFSRNELYGYPDMRKIRNSIFGDIVYLKLPGFYADMSSDEIRSSLEQGRDLEGMLDIQVQDLIRDWNLYSETTLFKQLVEMDPIEDRVTRAVTKEGETIRLTIVNAESGEEYASIACHERGTGEEAADGPEGKTLVIDEVPEEEIREFVLQEFLALCQKEGYRHMECDLPDVEWDMLMRFGFLPVRKTSSGDGSQPCEYLYELDLSDPVVMFFDAASYIKEPYAKEEIVRKAIRNGRNRLKESLADLYPGHLVLHINERVLHYKINRLIRSRNDIVEVESPIMDEGGLGETVGSKICVPFGKIMKGIRIPHTVTKILNAEKVYDEELKHFDFRELPDYPALPTQIRTIRSFNMPVILVDDIYHKGYRMAKMRELLAAESMEVSEVIVGVMSGNGREIADSRGDEVEAAYYIPHMRVWLQESDMYPFIGGDGILTGSTDRAERNALPSINTLLPYQMPSFLKGCSDGAVLQLSKVCLINAREIFLALEQVYWERHHRTLTFERIKEVFAEPRYPEGIDLSDRTMRKPVSEILTGEIHRLMRLYR